MGDDCHTDPLLVAMKKTERRFREWAASSFWQQFRDSMTHLAEIMPPAATPPLTLRRPRRLRLAAQPQETPDA